MIWLNAFFVTVMVLDSAHVVCPMLLTWTQPTLRQIALREWPRFVLLPLLMPVLIVWPPLAAGLYYAWNIHHFGMQNLGMWQLVQPVGYDRRVKRGLICLSAVAVGMGLLPILAPFAAVTLGGTVVFGFTHWIADIWLSSRVAKGWWFTITVLTFGVVWLMLRSRFGPLWSHNVPEIVLIRNCTLGFTHFIYSARIWKLSDPQVRATIGASLYV